MVKPNKRTTMETIGKVLTSFFRLRRLNCTKYHYLKFVEKQKVARNSENLRTELTTVA